MNNVIDSKVNESFNLIMAEVRRYQTEEEMNTKIKFFLRVLYLEGKNDGQLDMGKNNNSIFSKNQLT